MRKLLGIAALILTTVCASAQVRQSGNVTPGHVTSWTTNGIVQDGGTAANGALTSLGVTASGTGICQNSGTPTGAYNQICLTATATGLGITGTNYNGASGTLTLQQNGTTLPLGITPFTAPASQWINSISSTGVPSSTQPAATDISGLGTMATQNASAVAITGGTITGMPTPQISTDVATKAYVDINASGFHIHNPVVLATTAPLPAYNWTATGGGTLTAQSNGALSIDGVAVTGGIGQRVLVKSELNSGTACNGNVNAACDGIYTVTTAGNSSPGAPYVLVRSSATDSTGDAENTAAGWQGGDTVAVTSGSVNAGTIWANTTKILTLNTTAFTFFQFSSGISQPWQISGSNIFFSAGNVGIGTASPASPLSVVGNSSISGQAVLGQIAVTNPAFASVLFGSTTPILVTNDLGFPYQQTSDLGSDVASFSKYGADSAGVAITTTKSRNPTLGSHTIVQNGDQLHEFRFEGSDGSKYQEGATITATVDGAPSAGNVPGNLIFGTTPVAGGQFTTERMRITGAGNVGINNSSPASRLDVAGTFNASGAATLGSTLGVAGAISLTGASGLLSSTNALTMQTAAGTVSLNPTTNVVIGGTAPRISGLVSCGTIQTDSAGNTSCGTASGIGFAIDATKAPYNVKCDNSTNDTTAINNAIAAAVASTNTKTVILPSGTCIVNSNSIVMNSTGLALIGQGIRSTVFRTASSTGDVITMGATTNACGSATPSGMRLSGIRFESSATRTAGFAIKKFATNRAIIDNVDTESMFGGLALFGECTGGNGDYDTLVSSSYFQGNNVANSIGIQIGDSNCTGPANQPANIFLNTLDVSNNSIGILHVCESGISEYAVQGILNGTGEQFQPQSGQTVNWVFAQNSQWDTATGNGVLINPASGGVVTGLFYTNLWSATNGSTGINFTPAGTAIVRGVTFVNCTLINNQSHGAFIAGTAGTVDHVTFDGCNSSFNSASGQNVASGYQFGATGVSNISVIGGFAGNGVRIGAALNQQKYGIDLEGATSVLISGVNTTGNNTIGSHTNCAFTAPIPAAPNGINCGIGTYTPFNL